jgi:hypothetical protein
LTDSESQPRQPQAVLYFTRCVACLVLLISGPFGFGPQFYSFILFVKLCRARGTMDFMVAMGGKCEGAFLWRRAKAVAFFERGRVGALFSLLFIRPFTDGLATLVCPCSNDCFMHPSLTTGGFHQPPSNMQCQWHPWLIGEMIGLHHHLLPTCRSPTGFVHQQHLIRHNMLPTTSLSSHHTLIP